MRRLRELARRASRAVAPRLTAMEIANGLAFAWWAIALLAPGNRFRGQPTYHDLARFTNESSLAVLASALALATFFALLSGIGVMRALMAVLSVIWWAVLAAFTLEASSFSLAGGTYAALSLSSIVTVLKVQTHLMVDDRDRADATEVFPPKVPLSERRHE